MQIIEGDKPFDPPLNTVVTSGTFDGVHIGHQKILKRVTDLAAKVAGQSVVLTFWPHPRFVLKPDDHGLKLLSTFDEKCEILDKAGIDYLIKIPFTKDFSELSSEQFIKRVLIEKLRTHKLVIGYDHRFGKNREGSFDFLKQNEKRFDLTVEEIPQQDMDDVTVSSTKIRQALEHMDIQTANSYLGRRYSLEGIVVPGEKVGRKMGFPTANISVPQNYKLIPADGVYAVKTFVDNKQFDAMVNIGMRPTVGGTQKTIEANLLSFDGDLYEQKVKIEFVAPIRKELKFDSIDQLRLQLLEDREATKKLLSGK